MKIGIDARFFGHIGKGLGRYVQKLIEGLEKIDQKNQYFIFLRKENFDDYQPQSDNFKKILADYKWYSFQEQFFFTFFLKKYQLDLMHFAHFNVPFLYSGKFIVTIHDLILIHFPTIKNSTLHPIFYKFKFWAYKKVIKSAIFKSQKVITVSNFTRQDILKNYPNIPFSKILVTYEACDDFCRISFEKDEDIFSKYGIMKPYLLYVGNVYPHKNLERLVLAFEKISQDKKNFQLVLVGKIDYFYLRLKKIIENKKISNIILSGYIPDKELDRIFLNASVYVSASLYEGFGLPLLEAISKGTPVVVSQNGCAEEILGNSARYFDGENIDDMAEKIKEVISNDGLREKMIKRGYLQMAKYSWKKMAQKTKKIYEST